MSTHEERNKNKDLPEAMSQELKEQQEREQSGKPLPGKDRDPTLVGEAQQRLLERKQQQGYIGTPLTPEQEQLKTHGGLKVEKFETVSHSGPRDRPEYEAIAKAGFESAEVSHTTPEELERRTADEEIGGSGRQRVITARQQQVPVAGGVRQEVMGVVEPERKKVHVIEQGPGEAIVIKPKPSYFYSSKYLQGQRVGGEQMVRDATIDMLNSLVAKNTHCLLGRTGFKVSRICLGSMNFGRIDPQFGDRPGQLEEVEAHRILDRYVELGGNCIDTASFFPWFGSSGESERIIGSWLEQQKEQRERLFVITKVRMPTDPTDINSGGLSRAHIYNSVKTSLQNLRTDYVDMLMLNGWDPTVSVKETVRHLNELVEAGLVRYIGVCDFKGWQLQKFIDAARMLNMHKCVCYMGEYNLLTRGLEWEVIDVCRTERIGFFAYAPFKYGFLTKNYSPESTEAKENTRIESASQMPNLVSMAEPFEEMHSNPIYETLLNVCQRIGRERQLNNSQIAMLWALQRGFVTSCVVGVSSPQELDESMQLLSGDVLLTPAEMCELDAASRFRMHYPYALSLASVAGYKEIDPRSIVSFEQLSFINEYVPFEQFEQLRLGAKDTAHEGPWQLYPERQRFGEPSIQKQPYTLPYDQQQQQYQAQYTTQPPPQYPTSTPPYGQQSLYQPIGPTQQQTRRSPLQQQQRIGLQQSQEQTLQSGKDPKQPLVTQIKAQSAQFPPHQRT